MADFFRTIRRVAFNFPPPHPTVIAFSEATWKYLLFATHYGIQDSLTSGKVPLSLTAESGEYYMRRDL
jgi:hypothetical protein